MDVISFFRIALHRAFFGVVVVLTLLANPSFAQESQDTEIFYSGFEAYHNKNYQGTIDKMMQLLKHNPETRYRDMAIFWLGRVHFEVGHHADALKYLEQFQREYPDHPLRPIVESDLQKLAETGSVTARHEEMPSAVKPPSVEPAPVKVVATPVEKPVVAHVPPVKVVEAPAVKPPPVEPVPARVVAAPVAKPVVADVQTVVIIRGNVSTQQVIPSLTGASSVAAAPVVKPLTEKAPELQVAAAPAQKLQKLAAGSPATEEILPLPKKAPVARKGAGRMKGAAPKSSAAAMKENAIDGYKAVIDKYPGSASAMAASDKLKKLGVDYPPLVGNVKSVPGVNVQVLSLEVGQFADFAFELAPAGQGYEAGKSFSLPVTVANRGNGADSFYLEAGFPPEYRARFAARNAPDSALNVTPQLAPGEKFDALLTAVVPRTSSDRQKASFPIKVSSRFAHEVSQSREVTVVASAPLLRGVMVPDRVKVMPGGKVVYRIELVNSGSATATGVAFRLNYPPQYEPVDFNLAGFKQETKGALILDGIKLASAETREVLTTFQVKDDALARQELFLWGEMLDGELGASDSFLSVATMVEGVSGVAARTNLEKLVVIPGQTVTVPIVLTNTGNMREAFQIRPDVPAGITCRFFRDQNRDGTLSANASLMNTVGPLSPREDSYLVMELSTQPNVPDGKEAAVSVVLVPENDKAKNATVQVKLQFARPVVEFALTGKGGKLNPGEVSSYELNVVNHGSSLAKGVEVQGSLPDHLEVIASEPSFQTGSGGLNLWRFAELGAGEKRNIRVTFRIKPGIPVGTSLQIRNSVTYQDRLGNRY